MKLFKNLFIVFLLVFSLSACGEAEIKKVNSEKDQQTEEKSKEKYPAKKDLNDEEKLAIEFYEVFVKGTDVEAKKKFVSEKVFPETQPLFELAIDSEGSKDFNDLKVIESINKEEDGKTGSLVLVHSNNAEGKLEESVVAIIDKKIAFAYSPQAEDEELRNTFFDLRKDFNAEIPKETLNIQKAFEEQDKQKEEMTNKVWKVGETISINGLEITITSAKYTPPAEYSEPEKGKIITLEVIAKNNSEENVYVDNTEFTISDAEGNMHEQYYGYDYNFSNEVKVGKQYSGKIAFDVPESDYYEIYYEPSFSWDNGEIKFKVTKEELQ
jgi:Domain of unknown function (DUF4352)